MNNRKIPRSGFLPPIRIPVFAAIIYALCYQPFIRTTNPNVQALRSSKTSSHRIISLHNATKINFLYSIEQLSHDALPVEGSIRPGNSVRFTKGIQLAMKILSGGTDKMYRLYPGEDYSVQDLGAEGRRIFHITGKTSDVLSLAPFVPSPMNAVERVLEATGVNRESVIFDLGCGDGRVVIEAARKYGARGVGIDIDPHLIHTANLNARKAGVETKVAFFKQDIFDTDISEATVIYLYLFTDSNRLLRPFLEKSLTPGTLVACLNFKIPGWENKLVFSSNVPTPDDIVDNIIYIYRW